MVKSEKTAGPSGHTRGWERGAHIQVVADFAPWWGPADIATFLVFEFQLRGPHTQLLTSLAALVLRMLAQRSPIWVGLQPLEDVVFQLTLRE